MGLWRPPQRPTLIQQVILMEHGVHNGKTHTTPMQHESAYLKLKSTPMLHGSHFFFDSHAAWECDFLLVRHLCSENAIMFILSTRPQREAQK